MKKISQHLKQLGMGGLLLACAWIVPAAAHADRLEEIQARGSLKRNRQIYSMINANPAAASATLSHWVRDHIHRS